jgi:hypothetical protein
MAKNKKQKPEPTSAPVPEVPAQATPAHPPVDNPLLRHMSEAEDRNARECALQRLKALEAMNRAKEEPE